MEVRKGLPQGCGADVIPEDVGLQSTTPYGWIGTGLAILVTSVLGFRRWLSGDASARAENAANVEFLKTLMDQLDRANARAEQAERERNEAVTQIGELKAQIATLQFTVNHMKEQLEKMESLVCPT